MELGPQAGSATFWLEDGSTRLMHHIVNVGKWGQIGSRGRSEGEPRYEVDRTVPCDHPVGRKGSPGLAFLTTWARGPGITQGMVSFVNEKHRHPGSITPHCLRSPGGVWQIDALTMMKLRPHRREHLDGPRTRIGPFASKNAPPHMRPRRRTKEQPTEALLWMYIRLDRLR